MVTPPFIDVDEDDEEDGDQPVAKAPEEITFADLGLPADLLKAVTDMGYQNPTDIQRRGHSGTAVRPRRRRRGPDRHGQDRRLRPAPAGRR